MYRHCLFRAALVTSLRQEQLDAETVVKAENVANGNGVANTNCNADEVVYVTGKSYALLMEQNIYFYL